MSIIILHLNMEKIDRKEKALKQKHSLLVIDCLFSFGYISLPSGFNPTETEETQLYILCHLPILVYVELFYFRFYSN